MTRSISLITGIAVTALVLGVQVASGQERPATLAVSPEVASQLAAANQQSPLSILDARKKALGRDFQLGDFAANNQWQYAFSNGSVPVGDSHDRAAAASRSRVDSYVTEKPRAESVVSGYRDASGRAEPPVASERVSPTTSGSEIEWPELGIGFGVGMLVLLGLILTVRYTRSHPIAHG